LPFLARDKKREGAQISFVIALGEGRTELVPLEPGRVRDLVTG
jgi:hypothetical protein